MLSLGMLMALSVPESCLNQRHHKQLGLTLIEVLIALAIVAIAMSAIIKTVSENIRGTAYLEDKTIALYVAEQAINEARLGLLPLDDKTVTEKTDMLGREWYWQAEAASTQNKQIKRIIVRVYKTEPDDEDASTVMNMESYVYVPEKQ